MQPAADMDRMIKQKPRPTDKAHAALEEQLVTANGPRNNKGNRTSAHSRTDNATSSPAMPSHSMDTLTSGLKRAHQVMEDSRECSPKRG